MSDPSAAPSGPSRLPSLAAGTAAVAAGAWLAAHIPLGLDFTDEMQYYGEIAGLVRTGKFFQDDLFVQQLGYLLVLPFFKLHQALFPDLGYLVLFGRLVLVGAYGAVGCLVWQAARRRGLALPARWVGVAALLAWVPFQIFALGYNSMAYLLIVALGAVWLGDRRDSAWRWDLPLAGLLAALALVYPPAGLALGPLLLLEVWLRQGARRAGRFLAVCLGAGLALTAVVVAVHGRDYFADLAVALAFSRAFGVGEIILQPRHLGGLIGLLALGAGLIWQLRRSGPLPLGSASARAVMLLGLGLVAWMSLRGAIGYFATTVFVVVLVLLRWSARTEDRRTVADLATAGTVLGAVFAATSGNGVHNFGLGAMGVVPLLLLFLGRGHPGLLLAASALVLLTLGNGALRPYREQRIWQPFVAVEGVPAFAGLRVSPVKAEALGQFRDFARSHGLAGRRLLIAGPHAWIYFAAQAQPATPMFFMHFSGREEVYDLVAQRLFHGGEPDAVLITAATPRVLHPRIMTWAGTTAEPRTLVLPAAFVARYREQTGYDLGPEIVLLQRAARKP